MFEILQNILLGLLNGVSKYTAQICEFLSQYLDNSLSPPLEHQSRSFVGLFNSLKRISMA